MTKPVLPAATLAAIAAGVAVTAGAVLADDVDLSRNPLMDADGSHYCTPRVKFIAGQLHQLYLPCVWSTHLPEWRLVGSDIPT